MARVASFDVVVSFSAGSIFEITGHVGGCRSLVFIGRIPSTFPGAMLRTILMAGFDVIAGAFLGGPRRRKRHRLGLLLLLGGSGVSASAGILIFPRVRDRLFGVARLVTIGEKGGAGGRSLFVEPTITGLPRWCALRCRVTAIPRHRLLLQCRQTDFRIVQAAAGVIAQELVGFLYPLKNIAGLRSGRFLLDFVRVALEHELPMRGLDLCETGIFVDAEDDIGVKLGGGSGHVVGCHGWMGLAESQG
jgi:hypothetical protein